MRERYEGAIKYINSALNAGDDVAIYDGAVKLGNLLKEMYVSGHDYMLENEGEELGEIIMALARRI